MSRTVNYQCRNPKDFNRHSSFLIPNCILLSSVLTSFRCYSKILYSHSILPL